MDVLFAIVGLVFLSLLQLSQGSLFREELPVVPRARSLVLPHQKHNLIDETELGNLPGFTSDNAV